MKGSTVMFFGYLTMIGVPVLLLLLALSRALSPRGAAGNILLFIIGIGSIVYGVIGLREAYIHGGKRGERALRHRNQNG
jgi:hypothetical protein